MGFDIANGLSEMGKGIAQTAQAFTLENQRASLEKEKITLADTLAGAREDKQREFTKGERIETQAWQGGENALNRTSAKDIAQLQADTAVKTAGISAGATLGAARMNIEARAKEHGLDLDAQKPVREAQIKAYDAETLQKTIAADNAKSILDAKRDLNDAMTSGDPTKIAEAKTKIYTAEFSGKEEVQRVSLYQAQAKLIEQSMSAVQTRLVALQDPVKMMEPATKALADQLAKELERLRGEYSSATRAANEALKSLPTYSPPGATIATGAPDLNKYFKQAAPTGMINTQPGGP